MNLVGAGRKQMERDVLRHVALTLVAARLDLSRERER